MSEPRAALPAKLLVALLMPDRALLEPVCQVLCERFGELEMTSPWYPFDFTDYYAEEMGAGLERRVLVFRDLVQQDDLAGIKHITNDLEQQLRGDAPGRRVNIDPGYLLAERFVLATGKNFPHRISIGMGIYADLTLLFRNGGYQILEWTYPDYQEPEMRSFLLTVRKRYLNDLRQIPADQTGLSDA